MTGAWFCCENSKACLRPAAIAKRPSSCCAPQPPTPAVFTVQGQEQQSLQKKEEKTKKARNRGHFSLLAGNKIALVVVKKETFCVGWAGLGGELVQC